MLLQSAVLFLATLLGGLVVLAAYRPSPTVFNRLLLFAGGYLFAITVLHLLPELFNLYASSRLVGFYVLLGFFLQLLLELPSKGIEHGHLYETTKHYRITPWTLLVSLCIHAFLVDLILDSPTAATCAHHAHHTHGPSSLLIGMLLHKLPVAFALVSVLKQAKVRQPTIIIYLIIFALATPVGLWVSHYCSQQHLLSAHGLMALMAIASGSFLHIATTIFFEATPDHRLNLQKFIASLSGAALAVVLEWLL